MRTLLILALLAATPAFAAEPSGCDKFKWPVEADRAALTAPERAGIASGNPLAVSGKAVTLALRPTAEAGLPIPPERNSAPERFAGFVTVAAPPQPGLYTISLSEGLWVDVVQDGKFLKPAAFSGATDCAGIRKTMRFQLAPAPFTVQVSGGNSASVNLLVRPGD